MPQSDNNKTLRLGTRGSKLATTQSGMVRDMIVASGTPCELVIVKTSGDRIQDRSLADAGGKGLFTKELEEALLDGRIDLAVHSMKDVPVEMPPGLMLATILRREDPRDAFLSHKAKTLAELPKGARMGTSSVRRQAQLARARPDLEVGLLRGNVDTRLGKLDSGELDAILLAYAGLRRLGLGERVTSLLEPENWLPALAQGAIGIELREADAYTRKAVEHLNDRATAVALACERGFQAALDGSCRTPIAGLARFENGMLNFRGEVLSPDGKDAVDTSFTMKLGDRPEAEAAQLGRKAGLAIKPRAAAWLTL
ncbi:MAG: hydroxymethylbilane synthase [Alphaproteobacteria bacterium]|nr:hydroxymethylbilane synthase [Alphaproteobacteria bacterium]MDE2012887.1 hydroxymethylbilane synthase [Alphaproteobacteria bacterium]MDE2073405.1 hydroxymethylbilane synthase [Alphaproteobacteria bacterium]MDE2350700.1 hydroxymethylbilane synthase [Alphaproteobacteria bacterium]